MISQVPRKCHGANGTDSFCEFALRLTDDWHFRFVKRWRLFVHWCWIVWICGSNVCLSEPSSINSGSEWPCHYHIVTWLWICIHIWTQTEKATVLSTLVENVKISWKTGFEISWTQSSHKLMTHRKRLAVFQCNQLDSSALGYKGNQRFATSYIFVSKLH